MPSRPTKSTRSPSKKKSADPREILDAWRGHIGDIDGAEIRDTLDLTIFSHMALHMPLAEAVKAYQKFKSHFVDWNEVRISTAKEVQDVLRHGDEPLELAIFLKDFLNHLFTEKHHIGIDFLDDMTLSEVRSFFKKIGFAEATVNLILATVKAYPVVPIDTWMQPCVERLGLVKKTATPLQRQKDLYTLVADGQETPEVDLETLRLFHYYLAEHARQVCVEENADIDCPACILQKSCPYTRKKGLRKKAASKAKATSKATKSTTRRTTKKTTKAASKTTKNSGSKNGVGRKATKKRR